MGGPQLCLARNSLVLFWNTGCGFCQQMLPDLKEWEAGASEDAPRLVVVSAGSEEANREMGFTSPVLLDQNFAVGRAFRDALSGARGRR
jgi:thiol-disulfide isomerase/thioredoxin